MMPKQLQSMFARIIIHCNPSEPLKLWDKFKLLLSQDYYRQLPSQEEALKRTYQYLKYLLAKENKEKDFDITEFNNLISEDILREPIKTVLLIKTVV